MQCDVVVLQQWIGAPCEQPIVLDLEAGIPVRAGGLKSIDPALLTDGGNEIQRRKRDSQRSGNRRARHRNPGARQQSGRQGNRGKRVASHHADWHIREPATTHDQRQRQSRAVQHTTPERSRRVALAQRE